MGYNVGDMAFIDYDKFVLFGDSITEGSCEQTRGLVPTHTVHDTISIYTNF